MLSKVYGSGFDLSVAAECNCLVFGGVRIMFELDAYRQYGLTQSTYYMLVAFVPETGNKSKIETDSREAARQLV